MNDLRGPHANAFPAMFLDGSVKFIPLSTSPNTLRALFSATGGEDLSKDKLASHIIQKVDVGPFGARGRTDSP